MNIYPETPHIHKEWILEELKKLKPSTVLDVGCGSGLGVWHYTKELPDIEFTCIDSDDSVLTLNQHFAGRNVEFHRGDISKLPYTDETFDLVLCDSVFNCLTEEQAEIAGKEVLRVSKRYILLLEHHSLIKEGRSNDFTKLFPGIEFIKKVEGYGDPTWDRIGWLMLVDKKVMYNVDVPIINN